MGDLVELATEVVSLAPVESDLSHSLDSEVSLSALTVSPSTPSSGCSIEEKLVESSTTRTKSRPVQAIHTNLVPRHRAAMHIASPTERFIDLTLDPPGSGAEGNHTRWLTFRSGHVDIYLPPLSGSRISPSEASTDPRPGIDQTLAQVVGQREDMPVVCGRDTNLHSAKPNIRVSDTLPQQARLGHSRDYLVVLEHEAEILPSSPDHGPLVRGSTFACGNLPLSLGPYDKPRRVLHDDDFAYVVTAHGIIDQVGTMSVLKFDRNIRSPSLPSEEFVDDACILSHQGEPIIALGQAREQTQIAFLNLGHGQVSRHITLHRDWDMAKKPGVSAMTSLMSPLKFASGGYDHRVHLWDIAQDLSGASAVELAIKHSSIVHSLLPIMDTSHKLISVGADRDVHIYDMSAERVTRTLKMSCIPHHAHKTDTLSCTLLEFSHLETQFEVRDHRILDRAVQRFGFITEERRGRFEKGLSTCPSKDNFPIEEQSADTWSHFVGCGDKNGAVHIWDLRNVSTEVALRRCFKDPVIQVVNTGPRLLACSKRDLACINLQGG
ncbi:hypothetical protein J3R83DRAFT_580 [Lanmaoa asiatica]|nr:hypothetical protein J3R83DRAFT_580 [Lanmaoa asiatica]